MVYGKTRYSYFAFLLETKFL